MSTDHEIELAAYGGTVKRLNEYIAALETVVKALAQEPPTIEDDDRSGGWRCCLCRHFLAQPFCADNPSFHDALCPWAMAKELLASEYGT